MKTLFEATGDDLDEAVRTVTVGAPSGVGDRGVRSDEDHRLIAVIYVRDSIALFHRQVQTPPYRGMAPSRQLRLIAQLVGVQSADGETDAALSARVVDAVVDWLRRVLLPPPRPTA